MSIPCAEAQIWLLTSPPGERPEGALHAHLRACTSCRELLGHLQGVESLSRKTFVAPARPDAKAALLRRIGGSKRLPLPYLLRHLFTWRAGANLAACLALVAVGYLLGTREPSENIAPAPVASTAPVPLDPGTRPKDQLLVALARHNAALGETERPAERVGILKAMTADLLESSIEPGRRLDEVSLLAGLYRDLLRGGLVPSLLDLPAAELGKVVPVIEADLRAVSPRVEGLAAQRPPVWRDRVQPLVGAAQEALRELAEGKNLPFTPTVASPQQADLIPVVTLVKHGLLFARAQDPLERADLCSQLAERLSPTLVSLAVESEPASADAMATCIGALLEQGVSGNLARAQAEPGPPRLQQIEAIRARSEKSSQAVQRVLDSAPASAQAALRHALSAGMGKAKGKGSPWRRDEAPNGFATKGKGQKKG